LICEEIELTPNNPSTERETPIKLRKLEILIPSLTKKFGKIIVQYLFALLSVNFAPLWPHVQKTLVQAGNTIENEFWECAQNFLACLPQESSSGVRADGAKAPQSKTSKFSISWECTNLNQLRNQWNERVSFYSSPENASEFLHQGLMSSTDFVDYTNCYCLLLKTFGQIPALLQRHSKFFVENFRSIVTADEETTVNARLKILAYLEAFAQVNKPRKMHDAENLLVMIMDILANGDGRLQQASLNCIFNWQQSGVIKYRDALKQMANDDSLRDAVTTFDVVGARDSLSKKEQGELSEVVCRLLYGKIISRKGRNTRSIQKTRRVAIFGLLSVMSDEERDPMVKLMMAPFNNLYPINLLAGEFVVNTAVNSPINKQIGFLHILEDFTQQLRTLVKPWLDKILSALIHMIDSAEKCIGGIDHDHHEISQLKQIKLLSTKRLVQLFSIGVDFDFKPYMKQLFKSLIDPRVDHLTLENTQTPSAAMELFAVWANNARYVSFLVEFNPKLIPQIINLLTAYKVTAAVIEYVVRFVESIQDLNDTHQDLQILPRFLDTELLLGQYEKLLAITCSENIRNVRLVGFSIPTRIIRSLARISRYVIESKAAEQLVSMLVPFLKSPHRQVPEATKIEILSILANFMPILPAFINQHPKETTFYPILSRLFSTLESRDARSELLRTFRALLPFGEDLSELVRLLDDLNAWSTTRLEQPDFDRRFEAFNAINQNLYGKFQFHEWQPILHCLFFHVRDKEEFAVRSAATQGINLFIQQAKLRFELKSLLVHLVFPAVKKGIKEVPLPAREDFITILGNIVEVHGDDELFKDMVCLLGDLNDEETNFFKNMIHLQSHRRVKAIRTLAAAAREGKLGSSNISNIFVSMVAHIVFDSDKSTDHNAINEAIGCLAALSSVLPWGGYYGMLKRFLNALKMKPLLEKVLIRLLVAIINEFNFELNAVALNIDEEIVGDEVEDEDKMDNNQTIKIRDAVTMKLLPALGNIIATKDDESVPIRIPLAISIVGLLLKLPKDAIVIQLPKILLTICSILSSHLQSSRDSARNALITITGMLGSEYLLYILQSLKTALKRGYQLHVLGYTLHAILAENIDKFVAGSIDICIPLIMEICMHDIFGETGKEKEVQELRSKMREIRTTKSYDTIELCCRVIGLAEIDKVLLPVKEKMLETSELKFVKKLEELFRKIALGINANQSIEFDQFLIFVHKLMTESLPLIQVENTNAKKLSEAEKYIQVRLKRNDFAADKMKHYEANVHLFLEFGLSLLYSSLKSERLDPKDQKHLEMVDPLVAQLGKALYSKHVSTLILSLRIFIILIRWQLPDMEDTKPVILKRLFQLIARSANSDSDMMQNVLRLLTVVLRDCKDVPVPESKLIALVAILESDLENPEKQTVTFSLIRAVLDRQIMAMEVYKLMETVFRVMITSHGDQIRELCKLSYFQFLTKYPHGEKKMRKHMSQMISNLNYEYELGRSSILELLKLCVTKFPEPQFMEYAEMIFLAVVMVIINDDSQKCQEMASILTKNIFSRLKLSGMSKIIEMINGWFLDDRLIMKTLCCKVIALVIEEFGLAAEDWGTIWIQNLVKMLESLKEKEADDETELKFSLQFAALHSLSRYVKYLPALIVVRNQDIWSSIADLLNHPRPFIRLIAGQLFGAAFSHIDTHTRMVAGTIANQNLDATLFPLLHTELDIKELAKKFCLQIDTDDLDQEISRQIIKNLLFLVKCLKTFVSNNSHVSEEEEKNDEENDGELTGKFIAGSGMRWIYRKLAFLAKTDGKKKRGVMLVCFFLT
jgi:U3 small nucleolar RNA-associated protein 20